MNQIIAMPVEALIEEGISEEYYTGRIQIDRFLKKAGLMGQLV